MSVAVPGAVLDGRLARGVRARAAMVEALLDLFHSGDLRPSAARIAERAGVSLRSVFQHFSDMESIWAAAADLQASRLAPLMGVIADDGPLETRLTEFLAQRVRLLEAIAPVRRAAVRQEPFSAVIATRLRAFRRAKAAEVARVFRIELAARPPAARRRLLAALVAASSWNGWQALREHQGLSRARARDVLHHTFSTLLREG